MDSKLKSRGILVHSPLPRASPLVWPRRRPTGRARSTPNGSRPSCHNTWYYSAYAFDVSTNEGKALLSTVQPALLAGRSLAVTGGSTCTNTGGSVGNIETAQMVNLSGG